MDEHTIQFLFVFLIFVIHYFWILNFLKFYFSHTVYSRHRQAFFTLLVVYTRLQRAMVQDAKILNSIYCVVLIILRPKTKFYIVDKISVMENHQFPTYRKHLSNVSIT